MCIDVQRGIDCKSGSLSASLRLRVLVTRWRESGRPPARSSSKETEAERGNIEPDTPHRIGMKDHRADVLCAVCCHAQHVNMIALRILRRARAYFFNFNGTTADPVRHESWNILAMISVGRFTACCCRFCTRRRVTRSSYASASTTPRSSPSTSLWF